MYLADVLTLSIDSAQPTASGVSLCRLLQLPSGLVRIYGDMTSFCRCYASAVSFAPDELGAEQSEVVKWLRSSNMFY